MQNQRTDRHKNRNKSRHNKKSKPSPFLYLFGVVVFFLLIRIIISPYKTVDFFTYNNLNKNEKSIIFGDEITHLTALEDKDDIYFSLSFIKQYIDSYIFWDEEEKTITITTDAKVIRMKSEELSYYVNNEAFNLDLPFFIQANEPYLPSTLLKELYNIEFSVNSHNIIAVDLNEAYYTADVTKNADILTTFDNTKQRLSTKVKKGDKIRVYPKSSDNNYYKIRTSDGYIGYISKNAITEPKLNPVTQPNDEENSATTQKIDKKINLVFEQISSYSANNSFGNTIPEGVNVLCPTWFSFKSTEGDIKNIADKSYVDFAHKNNVQVWGLITDNFTNSISHGAISSSSARQKVIKQILAYCSLYELDGINIDFEAVPKTDGDYYVQFLRELSPLLKQQNVILSVDMFVPKPWTEHYNRKEVAKVADYIIVMGYDEHYATGGVSGSVASIQWSRLGITATLAQSVPKEKLILGIPFYTRLWKETPDENGNLTVTAKTYNMSDAKKLMKDNNVTLNWLEDMGQYYGEYKQDGSTYKMWLEDEKSIRGRVQLIKEYNIAGCGAWKRGLEEKGIWKAISEELNG